MNRWVIIQVVVISQVHLINSKHRSIAHTYLDCFLETSHKNNVKSDKTNFIGISACIPLCAINHSLSEAFQTQKNMLRITLINLN